MDSLVPVSSIIHHKHICTSCAQATVVIEDKQI